MKHITGTTKVFGLIGGDTSYSLSPTLHRAMLEYTGYNGVYVPFPVRNQLTLEAVLEACRGGAIGGLNITVPWKEKAAGLVDNLDRSASRAAAVNTVVHRQNGTWGYNTDGEGMCRSLIEESGAVLEGQRIVILGAGGAARGIIPALLQHRVKNIEVFNRTPERAHEVVDSMEDQRLHVAAALPDLTDAMVINSTSAGLKSDRTTLFSQDDIAPARYFYDLVYVPSRTAHMELAWKANVPCCNGLGMLIWQAVLAFEIITGKKCPVNVARSAVGGNLFDEE
ncbi:shikimate dehydrogenase [Desulfurispira natronophila]|uniref:Shikimate dehydrogenase (NADP(+)) n=1 Tax=Desulfurispira natronophila TaxID=682562 RepID=A0A7W7Y365_9BACT|nr:shikimate dehydrogenase [Desulfurispira natronophila]